MDMTLTPHPRLMTDRQGIQALRRRLAEDGAFAARFAAWREKTEELLAQPFFSEEYADSVADQHGRYYELGAQMLAMGEGLGLLYALTGEAKYARKLRDAMLHYAGFARWTGPTNRFRDPPWHGELATTRLLLGYAYGYDFCRDFLTEEERRRVENAMVNNGILPLLTDWVLPETRVHALDSMGHNWWSVCISLAGIGLLSVWEQVPEAEEWMGLILEALRGFCAYRGEPLFRKCANFDEKGLFYESLNYFNYGVGELLRFAFTWRRCGGDPAAVEWPELAHLTEAMLPGLYPTSDPERPLLAVDFGDSATDSTLRLIACYQLLMGKEDGRLAACWQAAPLGRDWCALDFLYPERLRGKTAPVALPEKDTVFPGGCAFLRDGWAPDSTLLAVRCGFTWNHAHEDAGHFVIFDRGVPLFTDSGCCPYGKPPYGTYYRRAAAHNLLLIDGSGPAGDPVERGTPTPGTLSHLTEGAGMTWLLADATGPMAHIAERNFRSFLRIDRDVLVILDDLRLYKEATLDWLIHYAGAGRFTAEGLLAENGPARGLVTPLFPHTAAFRQGYAPADWEHPVPYAAFTAQSREPVQALITVIRLDEAVEEVTLSPLTGPESCGVALQRGEKRWRIFFNRRADGRRMHVNSNNRLGDWDTDAYLLAESDEALLMAGGSYLRKGDRVLHASFDKRFLVIAKEK